MKAVRTKSLPRRRSASPRARARTIAAKRSRRDRAELVETGPGLLVPKLQAPFGVQRHRRLVTTTPAQSRVVERVREAISSGKAVSLVALVRRK